jgi:hypothetical protein
MVSYVGAEKSAPDPFSRLRQPCIVHHQSIGVGGGDYQAKRNPTMTNQIIISNISIHQDAQGRYSLNDLHKAAGNERRHEPSLWLALLQTKEMIQEILNTGIAVFKKDLIEEISKVENPTFRPVFIKKGRYGGTYVCKELVYSYAMWISAAFALKVIRAYDTLVTGKTEAKSPTRRSTASQLTPLRQTAERLITTGLGNIYPDIWKLVHEHFEVNHIYQLEPAQITEAVEFLNVLEGEYISREELPTSQIANIDLSLELNNINLISHHLKRLTEIWKESLSPALKLVNSSVESRFYSHLWDAAGATYSTKCAIEKKCGIIPDEKLIK